MDLHVREMLLSEVGIIIDYFHGSTPEHLNMLGVDPTRLFDSPCAAADLYTPPNWASGSLAFTIYDLHLHPGVREFHP